MRLRGAALAVFAALLLALALPNDLFPYGSPLLGVFALAPLLAALYRTPSYAAAARVGVIFGAVSSAASNFWLMFFQTFSVWTLGGVTLAYVAYFAVLGPLVRFIAGAPDRRPRRGSPAMPGGNAPAMPHAYRAIAVAVLWTLYEYLKSSGYLGFPWGLIAYPVHAITPLVQFVDITGVWGLSLLMALVNAVAAEWLDLALGRRRPPSVPARLWQSTGAAALLVVAALGYGAAALARPLPNVATLDVVLVQHNANPWQSGADDAVLATLRRLTGEGLAAAPEPPDLVVWSETALTWPVIGAQAADADTPAVPAALTGLPVPLLTGVPWVVGTEPLQAMNAAVLVAPGGALLGHYGKQHLVPFAESVPFWEVPAIRRLFTGLIGLQAPWVPGAAATIHELPVRDGGTVRFATPICFEDAFPYLNRRFVRAGADLLINLTNDAWSQTVSAETQHFVAARLRAVENRRVLIRATNGGVTAAVDPWGRLIGSPAPLFTETALRLRVPVYRPAGDTVYTRFGDWLPALLGVLLVPLLVTRQRRAARTG
ncbi:MAG: apolipoprotein N-acyltransferase [Spirochaetaceae bacterium]|nr:apolipoprotein N-acyltransferase [Spirochaetaceae bacterium]